MISGKNTTLPHHTRRILIASLIAAALGVGLGRNETATAATTATTAQLATTPSVLYRYAEVNGVRGIVNLEGGSERYVGRRTRASHAQLSRREMHAEMSLVLRADPATFRA